MRVHFCTPISDYVSFRHSHGPEPVPAPALQAHPRGHLPSCCPGSVPRDGTLPPVCGGLTGGQLRFCDLPDPRFPSAPHQTPTRGPARSQPSTRGLRPGWGCIYLCLPLPLLPSPQVATVPAHFSGFPTLASVNNGVQCVFNCTSTKSTETGRSHPAVCLCARSTVRCEDRVYRRGR